MTITKHRLILDIETSGELFSKLKPRWQRWLLRWAEDEHEKKLIRERTALWPLTGQVVTIGLLRADRDVGVIYYQAPGKKYKSTKIKGVSGITFKTGTEKEILEQLWSVLSRFHREGGVQVITFNGRGFDVPYLMIRSAINGVKPSLNLMGRSRYDESLQLDLSERLHFYGAVRKYFPLEFYADAFNIPNPKDKGVDAEMTSKLFRAKKYRTIARYCLRDLQATRQLYHRWSRYLDSDNF